MEYMALAMAAIALLEKLVPMIQRAVDKGEVTVDEQAALKARIDAIRAGTAFTGPEWKPSTDV